MRKISIALALVAGLFASLAHADFTAKDASLATITFKNPGACTSVVCTPIAAIVDSTGTNVVAVDTAGADAVSNTKNGLSTYGRNLVFNGTTWDRWLGDATNGGFVNVKTSVLPTGAGTSANQTTINTSIGTTNTNLGPPGATVCATDTGSCSLNALFQRALQTLTAINTTAGAAATFQAAVTGGASTNGNIVANNTTAVVIKASAGTLYGAQLYGIGSAPAYLKIYNAVSATCGTGTPVKRLMIPAASTAANGAGSNTSFGDIGVAFGTGITYCVTTGIGDADTTAPAASTYLVNLDWK